MRPTLIAAVAVGVWLASAGPLRAGLYNNAEPVEGPGPNKEGVVKPIPPAPFHSLLMDLRKIVLTNPESPQHVRYRGQRDKLREKERAGQLTEQDRVNLSAYLIRLGQAEDAVQVLAPFAGRDCRNFMILANLATANQSAAPMDPSRLTRASDYLEQALQIWPAEWPGFSKAQLDWYRQAETAQRNLLRLRTREAVRQQPGAAKAPATVDALFGPRDNPVHFAGASGQYEAGKLADAERAKLPPDAQALVQQLLVWMPEDDRLYWLYGELLNAQGDIPRAYEVFDYCVDKRNYNVPELRDHRLVVKEAKEALAAAPPPAPPSMLPGLQKMLIVGGLAGLGIVAFVYLQVREVRRRRPGILFDIQELLTLSREGTAVGRGIMEASPQRPLVIGWKEYVAFPDWGIPRVKVKIDTGARTSALDVVRYRLHRVAGQGVMAEMHLALDRRHPSRLTVVHTPVLRMVVVSNSNGMRERRPLIEATVCLGPVTKRVRLTITNRSCMLFRMILGRKALEGDFIVDVSRKYLLRK